VTPAEQAGAFILKCRHADDLERRCSDLWVYSGEPPDVAATIRRRWPDVTLVEAYRAASAMARYAPLERWT
jgi:hypothetical protein